MSHESVVTELEANLRDAKKLAENAARRSAKAKAKAKAENAAKAVEKLGVQTEKPQKTQPNL